MEDIGVDNGHLVYFVAISDMLWLFGRTCSPRFGMLYQEKSGNPALNA
jgi:hypothetical protein